MLELAGIAARAALDRRGHRGHREAPEATAAGSTRSRCGSATAPLRWTRSPSCWSSTRRAGRRPPANRPARCADPQPADVLSDPRYDDGYGWTYGGHDQLSSMRCRQGDAAVGPAVVGRRRSSAAIEVGPDVQDRAVDTADGDVRHHPARESAFRASTTGGPAVSARAERRLFDMVTLGGGAGALTSPSSRCTTAFWTYGRRRDGRHPAGSRRIPSDAVFASATWKRLHPIGAAFLRRRRGSLDRYRLDAPRVQAAVRPERDRRPRRNTTPRRRRCRPTNSGSSAARPARRALGRLCGRPRFLWSAELRVPSRLPSASGASASTVFMDGGTAAPYGEPLWDQPRHKAPAPDCCLIATVLSSISMCPAVPRRQEHARAFRDRVYVLIV